ncbi:hypothetical protein HMPREF1981_03263, partial [Bacteroides pyogenes F0041]
ARGGAFRREGGKFRGGERFHRGIFFARSIFFAERFSTVRGVKETSLPSAEGGWHGSDEWGGKAAVRESGSSGRD